MSCISGYNRRYVFAVFNIFGGNGNGVFILCFCNFERNYGFRAVIVFGRFYIRLYKVSARRRGNVFGISAVLFGCVSKFYFAEFRICRRYVCGFARPPSVKRKIAYRVGRFCNDKFKRKRCRVGFIGCFPFVSVFVDKFQRDVIFACINAAVIFDNGVSVACFNGRRLLFTVINF